jgi:hypothetical protein
VEGEVPSQTVIPGLSTIYPAERTEYSSEPAVKAEDEGDSSLVRSDADSDSDSTTSHYRPEYGESGPNFESSSSDSASEPAIKVESEDDDDSFSAVGLEAQSSPQPATNALAEGVEDSVMERERLEHEEEAVRFYHDNVPAAMEPAEERSEETAVGQDAQQPPESVIQWMERELGVELDGLREGKNKKQ